jgi:hypothetical protein
MQRALCVAFPGTGDGPGILPLSVPTATLAIVPSSWLETPQEERHHLPG